MFMAEKLISILENEAIKPSLELGAFEALFADKNIITAKQIREKLKAQNVELLSKLVDKNIAQEFYKKTIERLGKAGIHNFGIRIEGTFDYPEKLRDADYPLAFFYYRGIWDLIYSRGVSVVGTRKPTIEGVKRTQRLVKELVKENFTIYSGLAAGIDTAAHTTAIENNGLTVAVIGTPLWLNYPKENAELQDLIANKYLLISQVPIVSYDPRNIKLSRIFFPERNVTMSALTEATIIVEAGETSGTLIQARAALKQGRKVFILNNNFENPSLVWPHKLEQAGAIRVSSTEDILEGLSSETIQTSTN
jgi:DNA processing protein